MLSENQDQRREQFRALTKSLYDRTKNETNFANHCLSNTKITALKQLHTEQFGDEEVWSQIDLENEPVLNALLVKVSRLSSFKQKITFGLSSESIDKHAKHSEPTTAVEIASDDDDTDSDNAFASSDLESQNVSKSKPKKKGSVVDDKFFKLSQMEEFLKQEDIREERMQAGEAVEDDDDIDLFADFSDDESGDEKAFRDATDEDDEADEELKAFDCDIGMTKLKSAREATYGDFFDDPDQSDIGENEENYNFDENENENDNEAEENNEISDEEIDTRDVDSDYEENEFQSMKNGIASDSDDSDGETVEQILGKGFDTKSTFEKQQEKVKEKIKKLELQNLSGKPWQLKGEIGAEKRPENSLLEEHLQFDHTSRQPPLITEETTKTLEEIIKQRIKDGIWDDVERKQKQVQKPFEYRQRLLLDHEKSKASLAQVYEEEYLKKQKEHNAEEENSEHKEIKQMMKKLFLQLDALSNFNFTPKLAEPEVKLINNLPAITVEEATPLTVSDAALLAPEEVVDKPRAELKATSEKDSTDKKRERRLKKKLQGRKFKHQQMKAKMQTGSNYTKLEISQKVKEAKKADLKNEENKELKSALKSSKAFFAKLQDQIHNSAQVKKAKKKEKQTSIKQLKL
ncbi:U3 small nucleolar ribonucleoprotein MPP10-like protein [Dinothrombium tinctorium]|uniref:U3 small nucleolar ribonucleoprotein protein MPP10 n=1 Tax=Dinothrombium tinctorium TaxID=1965070 RepID=A0A3S3RUF7_9ACAR|nr:U3 small nucleolar ribonucleoprotein MPP10-like protein [Dinothrombium tinctorium]